MKCAVRGKKFGGTGEKWFKMGWLFNSDVCAWEGRTQILFHYHSMLHFFSMIPRRAMSSSISFDHFRVCSPSCFHTFTHIRSDTICLPHLQGSNLGLYFAMAASNALLFSSNSTKNSHSLSSPFNLSVNSSVPSLPTPTSNTNLFTTAAA